MNRTAIVKVDLFRENTLVDTLNLNVSVKYDLHDTVQTAVNKRVNRKKWDGCRYEYQVLMVI